MVTGSAFDPLSTFVPSNRLTSPELPPHLRAVSLDDEDERPAGQPSSQMNQVLSAIRSVPTILKLSAPQTKVLHTEVPYIRGSKDKFNEFD